MELAVRGNPDPHAAGEGIQADIIMRPSGKPPGDETLGDPAAPADFRHLLEVEGTGMRLSAMMVERREAL